jgi:Fe2+ transport system protein B
VIKFDDHSWAALIAIASSRNAYLSGNVVKLIDDEENPLYREYLDTAINRDKDKQKQRLDVTKKAQKEKKKLEEAQQRNDLLMKRLEDSLASTNLAKEEAEQAKQVSDKLRAEAERARAAAERAKDEVERDLDVLQRRTQSQLMHNIVNSAIQVVIGVGGITSALYLYVLVFGGPETQVSMLGNTWSNMFGILLTNSFSIIGTVMGVKYATEKQGE